jgi:hypothetical protein
MTGQVDYPHSQICWKIKKGDLVKLKQYSTGHEHDVEYLNGVVISDILDEPQLSMWPYVKVYIFNDEIVRDCDAGCLEIISNS